MAAHHNLTSLHQEQQQQQQQQQQVMDEMMEQILSMPSWTDSGGGASSAGSKLPWDYSNISGGMAGLETMVALLNTNNNSNSHHLLDPDGSIVLDGSGLISQLKQQQQQQQQQQLHCEISGLNCSTSVKNNNNNNNSKTSSAFDSRSSESTSWHQQQQQQQQQQYTASIPSNLNFGCKAGDALTDAHMLGKRLRDEQQQQQAAAAASLMENLSAISGQDAGIFSGFGASHAAQSNIARTSSSSGQKSAQGLRTSIPAAGAASVPEISEAAAASQGTPVVRPRVRARRGQATDPHSIAERLRRERIAERMKSLQELVPNSNKTDKASMLDEIIDYVKFLQLQVKVLSMSRLGNAGAVMADLPAEDSSKFLAALGQNGGAALQEGISLTERQVAKLMEEDMGSAMQYLQSKGLCLMPIHLASNMSKNNNNNMNSGHKTGSQQQQQQQQQQQPVVGSSANKMSTGTLTSVKNAAEDNSGKNEAQRQG